MRFVVYFFFIPKIDQLFFERVLRRIGLLRRDRVVRSKSDDQINQHSRARERKSTNFCWRMTKLWKLTLRVPVGRSGQMWYHSSCLVIGNWISSKNLSIYLAKLLVPKKMNQKQNAAYFIKMTINWSISSIHLATLFSQSSGNDHKAISFIN